MNDLPDERAVEEAAAEILAGAGNRPVVLATQLGLCNASDILVSAISWEPSQASCVWRSTISREFLEKLRKLLGLLGRFNPDDNAVTDGFGCRELLVCEPEQVMLFRGCGIPLGPFRKLAGLAFRRYAVQLRIAHDQRLLPDILPAQKPICSVKVWIADDGWKCGADLCFEDGTRVTLTRYRLYRIFVLSLDYAPPDSCDVHFEMKWATAVGCAVAKVLGVPCLLQDFDTLEYSEVH